MTQASEAAPFFRTSKPATSPPVESAANRALIARADAICRSTEAQAAAASAAIKVPHKPDGPREAFVKTALATLAISDRGLAALRALGPAGALPPHWPEFVADVAKEDSSGHALLRAAQTQNTIAAAEAQITQRNAELDLEKVSDEDGFRVCGKPANA